MYDVQVCKLSHIQKQWRNFSFRDYKFCSRMFVLFKRVDTEVFINTPSFSDLPREAPVNKKRKSTGRGAHKKKKKSRVDALESSTSEVDSPAKTLVIDMDACTDDDQEDYVLRNDKIEEQEENGGEGDGSGENDGDVFTSNDESGDE